MHEADLDFVERPLVYLAGPYTSPDPVANTHATIRMATQLCHAGDVTPVVPHLTMLWHAIEPQHIEFWYAYDLALLARCDAVLRLAGASTGADREVAFANERGIPVFTSLQAMLAYWSER
jgi:nucleoside 2-deoxyribosyltransferase